MQGSGPKIGQGSEAALAALIRIDIVPPEVPVYNTEENQWFSSNPTLDINFSDEIALEKIEYKIDSTGWWRVIADEIVVKALHRIGFVVDHQRGSYIFLHNLERISTRALQTLLGHDRLTTTEIYLNLSPEGVIREFLNKR